MSTPLNSKLPRHVAIIMDGNGRWARKRHLPRVAGHKAGVENVRQIVRCCADQGIEALTLFAFSSENWRRPPAEVRLLLDLFLHTLRSEVAELAENGIVLRVIGNREQFPEKLRDAIAIAERHPVKDKRLELVIAANYGGHWDIEQAIQRIGAEIAAGERDPGEVTSELIGQYLSLADLPEPDLFIRSGGEQRISNFLLWQLAYTELYFTDTLWPDFDRDEFSKALDSFAGRQRRFGMTGDQVNASDMASTG